jgi:hypothetical protein
MRLALLRAASSGCLGAALVLAAPSPTVRLAAMRAALSRLEAVRVLAPLAATMRHTVPRVA